MFNKLTCKVRFHVAVWSLSKSIRASSFIENFPQISAKPIAFQRNLLGKLPRNRPFFTNRFSAKLTSKIPAKSVVFSANLPLKIPRNLTFFSATYQKPWCYARGGGGGQRDEVGTLNVLGHPGWGILANFEHKYWPRDREVWTMLKWRKRTGFWMWGAWIGIFRHLESTARIPRSSNFPVALKWKNKRNLTNRCFFLILTVLLNKYFVPIPSLT